MAVSFEINSLAPIALTVLAVWHTSNWRWRFIAAVLGTNFAMLSISTDPNDCSLQSATDHSCSCSVKNGVCINENERIAHAFCNKN